MPFTLQPPGPAEWGAVYISLSAVRVLFVAQVRSPTWSVEILQTDLAFAECSAARFVCILADFFTSGLDRTTTEAPTQTQTPSLAGGLLFWIPSIGEFGLQNVNAYKREECADLVTCNYRYSASCIPSLSGNGWAVCRRLVSASKEKSICWIHCRKLSRWVQWIQVNCEECLKSLQV